ncbi:MAG: 23S rRNA (pseudouridine(1915)-N(3))-methyltransferase RlmH [Gemmatimonadetes bacterium]|nr:23S rRNA (pseudouridine(1915)-N(3))-methyltransferase RlmH [Gemmatimonadota bacterium]
MIVHVLAVGKLRDASVRAACQDYVTRARRYFRIEVREVAGRASKRSALETTKSEGKALLAALPENGTMVALTRTGRAEDSQRFAGRVAAWQRSGRDVALLIGGAFGLDPEVLQRSDSQLSLSSFTLPHEMARLVLLEQLYRAGTILKGEPYHKGSG